MRGTEAFCFCYIDDILVFSADEQQLKIHLHEVANRLNAYCLKLNMDKCSFGMKEITTLSYTVSAKGIAASREKVKAIQNLPQPATIKQLKQVLDLINYQRKFICNAASILAPLTAYLKGKVQNAQLFTLSPQVKQAFVTIKQALANAAYLAHPADNETLFLRTDASCHAFGAILE